jgi:hypothetical protein
MTAREWRVDRIEWSKPTWECKRAHAVEIVRDGYRVVCRRVSYRTPWPPTLSALPKCRYCVAKLTKSAAGGGTPRDEGTES